MANGCATRSKTAADEKFSSTTTPSITARSGPLNCAGLSPEIHMVLHVARVTTDYDTLKAMKEAGCRLLIVGYESATSRF